jgi:serine/threonine protein kinase
MDTMKIVLIDFGASAIFRSNSNASSPSTSSFSSSNNQQTYYYTDFHGTRQYKPPEYITNKKYTAQASTIWTLGILLYDMCNGQLPFETEQEILDYNLTIKTNLSDEYKQLLFDCLKQDPNQRPTLCNLLNYTWLSMFDSDIKSDHTTTLSSSVGENGL